MGSLGGWVGGLRQVKLVGPSFACDAPPRSEKLRGNRFFAVRTFAATCYSVVGAAGNVGQQPTTHSAVAYRLAERRPATESTLQPATRQYGSRGSNTAGSVPTASAHSTQPEHKK